jgi:hypothetical protein
MGIEQLVDTFKGTPQPLQAKVERDNKGQPPGAVPKDLQEVIALQEIAKIRQGVQNQQAMQAGGVQPSVAEKLRQMVGAMRAQGQPQTAQAMPQQPVMAARGGSIDQLISNLGRHYAGGGIIAFNPGGEVKLGTDFASFLEKMGTNYVEYANSSPEAKASLKEMYAEAKSGAPASPAPAATGAAKNASLLRKVSEGTGKVAGKLLRRAGPAGLALEAASHMGNYKIKDPDEIDTSLSGTLSDLSKGEFGRVGTGLKRGLGEAAMDAGSFLANMADYVVPGKAPVSSRYDKFLKENVENLQGPEGSSPAPSKEETAAANAETEKLKRLAGVKPQTGQNTNPALKPKPPAPAPAPAPSPKPPVDVPKDKPGIDTIKPEAMDPMEVALRAAIMKAMGKDADQEFEKGAKRHQEFMGLDKLLQPREARIAEREGMLRKIQGDRLPDWVAGLDRASKPIVSGGIGTLLNQYGTGKQDQKKAYDTEDLKFFDQISDMKDEVVKLKIEGNYKAAAAGEAAIKDMLADRRQAEQSGTSLLNTKENVRSREQVALDNRLGRQQSARQHSDNQALALEERKRQFNESELRKIRERDVDRSNKIENAIAKRVGNIDLQLQMPNIKPEVEADLLRRRNAIVKQVQAEYPSIKPERPASMEQFLAAARAANPGVSEADLKAYYKKTYG